MVEVVGCGEGIGEVGGWEGWRDVIGCLTDPKKNHYLCNDEAPSIHNIYSIITISKYTRHSLNSDQYLTK